MSARESNDGVGSLGWKANARLLLNRLEYVGRGAVPASARRSDALERAAAVRRSVHWLFRRPQ